MWGKNSSTPPSRERKNVKRAEREREKESLLLGERKPREDNAAAAAPHARSAIDVKAQKKKKKRENLFRERFPEL